MNLDPRTMDLIAVQLRVLRIRRHSNTNTNVNDFISIKHPNNDYSHHTYTKYIARTIIYMRH